MSAPKSRRFLDIAIDKLGDKYGDPMRIRRAIASVSLRIASAILGRQGSLLVKTGQRCMPRPKERFLFFRRSKRQSLGQTTLSTK